MRGHLIAADDEQESAGTLASWESMVVDTVGNVIDFWGFKRNQGRVWAVVYLRGHPMTAQEMQESLGLSKGAVSMITRELEQWGVLERVRSPSDAGWRFEAETDLARMISKVIESRELNFVSRVRADLEQAEKVAHSSRDATDAVRTRIARLRTLSVRVEKALKLFVQTARLDAVAVLATLTGTSRSRNDQR